MLNTKMKKVFLTAVVLAGVACAANAVDQFPLPISEYGAQSECLWRTLGDRIKKDPFNLWAALIFLFAIVHTFVCPFFESLSKKVARRYSNKLEPLIRSGKLPHKRRVSLLATTLHYMGEIETVFAIWLIPLFAAIVFFKGHSALLEYLNSLMYVEKKFTEPAFVIVIMTISATRPVIRLAEDLIGFFARIGSGTPAAWWCAILIIGPLLGSFITEPAAITISAMLLHKKIFKLRPSGHFKYYTLAVLLASVSVGGTLTHFAAPPVLMIAAKWDWGFLYMLENFGLSAVVGIVICVVVGRFAFAKDFAYMAKMHSDLDMGQKRESVTVKFIMMAHVFFLAYSVMFLHHIVLLCFGFLLFLAFVEGTAQYQNKVSLRSPVLVGLFLTGLVIHGGLQAWWIEPLLGRMGKDMIFFGSMILSAFNDNAAITYLASLVPNLSDTMKYMVVAGAVSGGGLTIIANAPNPAGVSILSPCFKNGVSPVMLLLYALFPAAVMVGCFMLF